MPTQCSQTEMDFGSSGGRKIVGAFDGGAIPSNGGAVFLGAADRAQRVARPRPTFHHFREVAVAGQFRHAVPLYKFIF